MPSLLTQKNRLSLEEFRALLLDLEVSLHYSTNIDNILMGEMEMMEEPEEEEEEEEEEEKPAKPVSVDEFLISFLQSKAKSKANMEPKVPPDPFDKIAVVYSIFETTHTGSMTFADFVNMMKWV